MANCEKGRDLLLQIFDAGVYKLIGGITTKSLDRDLPVVETTSSSTPITSNESEACHTGFATETLSGSGVVDNRSDVGLLAFKVLEAASRSNNAVVNLRFSDAQSSSTGNYLITSFGKNTEQTGIVEFSVSFQNEGQITYA